MKFGNFLFPDCRDPGRDGDPARDSRVPEDPLYDGSGQWRLLPSGPDWMDDEQWEACQASRSAEQEPDDPGLYQDPDSAPPDLDDGELAALIAGARELSADEARAMAQAARLGSLGALAAIGATDGRRGPGQPGSARTFPGEFAGDGTNFVCRIVDLRR